MLSVYDDDFLVSAQDHHAPVEVAHSASALQGLTERSRLSDELHAKPSEFKVSP